MTENQAKIAIVTGASRGLGKNTALALGKKGINVILTYHSSAESADSVVSAIAAMGGKAAALQLDTANIKTFDGFGSKVNQLLQEQWQTSQFDFLVNNAGIGINKSFVETTEADFDQLMNIHLKGVFFLTQKLLPMIKDGGRIVNISSGLARFTLPGYSAYATMKGGIEVLTPSLLVPLPQISVVAKCGTINRSTALLLLKLLWVVWGYQMILAVRSPPYSRKTIAG
jgi:NAD(P)-dependent dehydrogenase (short-subunit alcohol dehydrogenase family)